MSLVNPLLEMRLVTIRSIMPSEKWKIEGQSIVGNNFSVTELTQPCFQSIKQLYATRATLVSSDKIKVQIIGPKQTFSSQLAAGSAFASSRARSESDTKKIVGSASHSGKILPELAAQPTGPRKPTTPRATMSALPTIAVKSGKGSMAIPPSRKELWAAILSRLLRIRPDNKDLGFKWSFDRPSDTFVCEVTNLKDAEALKLDIQKQYPTLFVKISSNEVHLVVRVIYSDVIWIPEPTFSESDLVVLSAESIASKWMTLLEHHGAVSFFCSKLKQKIKIEDPLFLKIGAVDDGRDPAHIKIFGSKKRANCFIIEITPRQKVEAEKPVCGGRRPLDSKSYVLLDESSANMLFRKLEKEREKEIDSLYDE